MVAPFLFLILVLLIDKSLQANNANSDDYKNIQTPTPESVGPIPSCHSDMYIASKSCTELLYAPNNSVTNVRGESST